MPYSMSGRHHIIHEWLFQPVSIGVKTVCIMTVYTTTAIEGVIGRLIVGAGLLERLYCGWAIVNCVCVCVLFYTLTHFPY